MKIDLTVEVLKHSDEEIIEFLTDKMRSVVKLYAEYENPADLVGCAATLGLVYSVLKGLDERNKKKTGQDEAVVL